MAIQSFQLDPGAQAYTDDQIVAKINSGTIQITRASAVAAAARPITSGEIDNTKLVSGVVKTNLDAMADTARGYVKTDPASGQYRVITIERQADGKLNVKYDDVAM